MRETLLAMCGFLAVGGLLTPMFLAAPARSQTTKASDELRILFIGNSLTSVNDLPKMLATPAQARPLQALAWKIVPNRAASQPATQPAPHIQPTN